MKAKQVILFLIILIGIVGCSQDEHVCTFETVGEIESVDVREKWSGAQIYKFELTNGIVILIDRRSFSGYAQPGETLYKRTCRENVGTFDYYCKKKRYQIGE